MLIHVLGVILTSILFKQAYSCSCLRGHAQDTFCSADAVIKGKVLSEEIVDKGLFMSRRVYGLKLRGVYRDESDSRRVQYHKECPYRDENNDTVSGNNLQKEQEIQVKTAGDGAMCGITLDIGEEYYLTAYKWGNSLSVGLCGMHTKTLTQQQMDGMEEGKFDCTCTIQSRWHRIPRNETHLSCNLDMIPGAYDINCLMREAFCRFDEHSQRCSWEADERKEICKRWSLPPFIEFQP